jgi:hypothetical protein
LASNPELKKLADIVKRLDEADVGGGLTKELWYAAVHEAEQLKLPEGCDIEPVIAYGSEDWLPVE